MERHRHEKLREEGGEKAGQGRHCSELSLSHPRAGCVYRAVSHEGRPLPGDTGHQGDEKIIAPSVRASRDRGLMDTTGN
ncbi:hypothetical protein PBY51_009835 [Eleginops maclovinus]|uniref:Uncharacterized protein n=1 Tax=Eleginops maclovinus TaxID=56733 RepID=A0AAN8AQR7_ELEMC|nr:hypothetical protein PBY51_009835 [Eleginops maclovinus]